MSSKPLKEETDEDLNILEDEVIEKPKPEKKTKPKKEWIMTPARAENLKKAQVKLRERQAKLKEEKEAREAEERKIIEEKVIKKAIAIKKRQLKKEAVIDEIPVDIPLRPKPKPIIVEPKYEPKYKFY